jgi:Transglutaminase-like superfamily
MPRIENKHGLKQMFDILSYSKDRSYCDKDIIKRYVHLWISIKGIFKVQYCWNRTLLLYKFLNDAGYNVIIYTGVRKDSMAGGSITGHSWVTIDGRVFDDRADIADGHYITFHYPHDGNI